MPVGADLTAFTLASQASVAYLDTVELGHSSWDDPFRYVRNVRNGVTARLENDQDAFFPWIPLRLNIPVVSGLHREFSVEVGDLGETLPDALDLLRLYGRRDRPYITYRAYRSDDLLGGPIVGPWTFEVFQVRVTQESCTFNARSSVSSVTRTGTYFRDRDFPTLRTR